MKRLLSIRIALMLLACFSLGVLPQGALADLILAQVDNGNINTDSTWNFAGTSVTASPTAGDLNQWGTSTFTIRATTETWEGQEMLVQTGGRFASGSPGPTVTFNGDLTLDGGTVTVLNNNPFLIDLNGNTLNLNSGVLDSGGLNTGRDLIFQNAVLAGSGTISVQGGASAARSAVIFQNNTVSTSGFTGTFDLIAASNFFLPEILAADASFGITANSSGQLALTENIAVTSAVLDGITITPGTYTRQQLIDDFGVNSNRILAAGADSTLTVVSAVPEPSSAAVLAMGAVALFVRRRK